MVQVLPHNEILNLTTTCIQNICSSHLSTTTSTSTLLILIIMSSNTQKKPRAATSIPNTHTQKTDTSRGKCPSAGGKTKSSSKQSGVIGAFFAPVLFQPSKNSTGKNGNSIPSGVNVEMNKGIFSFVIEVLWSNLS